MYDQETISRLGYGPQIRQQRKPERRMSRQPGADGKRLAVVATGPVCRAARYSPVGKRAGGGGLREGQSEDEAEGDDMIVRLVDEIVE